MKNNNDKFNFFLPIEFEKSKNEKEEEQLIFWGMASDNSKDSEGEILEPSGYELDHFLKYGYFNIDHLYARKGDPKFLVGEPIDAKIKGNELFVKGMIWKDSEMGRNFWEAMKTMKSSGSKRVPGMSIEGKTLEKDPNNPKRITKAKITHIALTMSPINRNSWVEIVKGEQKEDFIPVAHNEKDVSGGEYLIQMNNGDSIITINKDYSIKLEKKKAVDTEGAKSLAKESIKKKTNSILKALKTGLISKSLAKELALNFFS